MGFSTQEYWSGLPFPSPGDLPDSGIEPGSPALQADALPSKPPGKPMKVTRLLHFFFFLTYSKTSLYFSSVLNVSLSPDLNHIFLLIPFWAYLSIFKNCKVTLYTQQFYFKLEPLSIQIHSHLSDHTPWCTKQISSSSRWHLSKSSRLSQPVSREVKKKTQLAGLVFWQSDFSSSHDLPVLPQGAISTPRKWSLLLGLASDHHLI